MSNDYETAEGVGRIGGGVQTVEEARRLHHLATADPERDGQMTGPAHEKLYGLEREAESASLLRAAGVCTRTRTGHWSATRTARRTCAASGPTTWRTPLRRRWRRPGVRHHRRTRTHRRLPQHRRRPD